MRPIVAVTSGKPAGIGPELCLQLTGYKGAARPVILADRNLLQERAAALGLEVALIDFCPENDVDRNILEVLHVPLLAPSKAGQLNTANDPFPAILP